MPEGYAPQPDYEFARDFKGYGEKGLNLEWPSGAKIAVSFVINYEEVSIPAIWSLIVLLITYSFLKFHTGRREQRPTRRRYLRGGPSRVLNRPAMGQ